MKRCTPKERMWEEIRLFLWNHRICYADLGKVKPDAHGGCMNYGEAVQRAMLKLEATNLSLKQLRALEQFVYWIVRTADVCGTVNMESRAND